MKKEKYPTSDIETPEPYTYADNQYMVGQIIDRLRIALEDIHDDVVSDAGCDEEPNTPALWAIEWLHQHLSSLLQLSQDPQGRPDRGV